MCIGKGFKMVLLKIIFEFRLCIWYPSFIWVPFIITGTVSKWAVVDNSYFVFIFGPANFLKKKLKQIKWQTIILWYLLPKESSIYDVTVLEQNVFLTTFLLLESVTMFKIVRSCQCDNSCFCDHIDPTLYRWASTKQSSGLGKPYSGLDKRLFHPFHSQIRIQISYFVPKIS